MGGRGSMQLTDSSAFLLPAAYFLSSRSLTGKFHIRPWCQSTKVYGWSAFLSDFRIRNIPSCHISKEQALYTSQQKRPYRKAKWKFTAYGTSHVQQFSQNY